MSVIVSVQAPAPASPPVLLIVTDVFGNTPAVASFARQFPLPSLTVSPFSGEKTQYPAETLAYHAFIAEGGVAAYAENLARIIEEHQSSLRYAIGFSAGASALWLNSAMPVMASLQQAVLFYGSRIRDHREVKPVCPMRLIFAEQEAAFEPAELVADLRRRNQDAELVKGSKHGFMNPYSAGFCLKTQERFMKELLDLTQINVAA